MNAGRVVVNTPSSQGAVGGIYNKIKTSFTLGCGAGGKNITTENVSAIDLINIKRVLRRRNNERLFSLDQSKFFDESIDVEELYREYLGE
jgi:acetaldehyde dehydrogenase/alcohol dehydrogenase